MLFVCMYSCEKIHIIQGDRVSLSKSTTLFYDRYTSPCTYGHAQYYL